MDIGALNNIALNQLSGATSTAGQTIGLVMLSKQLDVTDSMSSQMIKAMENSVNPNIGSNFDVSV